MISTSLPAHNCYYNATKCIFCILYVLFDHFRKILWKAGWMWKQHDESSRCCCTDSFVCFLNAVTNCQLIFSFTLSLSYLSELSSFQFKFPTSSEKNIGFGTHTARDQWNCFRKVILIQESLCVIQMFDYTGQLIYLFFPSSVRIANSLWTRKVEYLVNAC